MPAWEALEGGCRHLELVWHRRSGKDDIALNWAAVAATRRPANYWHMLPLSSQARKAIWHAVNPHTGKRRIDEAFPKALRVKTLENEMLLQFKNGSTWQVLGSDNYDSAVGSTPAGIVFSEWALANPSARGYLRPILVENNGWQMFIGTPRGRNHAFNTFRSAQKTPGAFAQLLSVNDTGLLSEADQAIEKAEYVSTYGEDIGDAMFRQEYLCDFNAAILGAVWGSEVTKAREQGRITRVDFDPDYPVNVAMDIGRTDDTSIWWYQVIANRIHVLEHESFSLQDPDYVCSRLLGRKVSIDIIDREIEVSYGGSVEDAAHRQAYTYGQVAVPHDAMAKTFAAKGKSVMEQLLAVFGSRTMAMVHRLSKQDGHQAGRRALAKAWFDEEFCEYGIDALASYRRAWDDKKKAFTDDTVHDWTSHPADGWRYLGIMWEQAPEVLPEPEPVYARQIDRRFKLDELWSTAYEHTDDRIR